MNRSPRLPIRNPQSPIRNGFTLVELLVVIGILLALTVLVVAVYTANAGGDRLRSAARTAQSAILGGRDRALHARERRGIRFIRDPQDANLVTGFAYLQPLPLERYGQPNAPTVTVCRPDADNNYAGADALSDDPNLLVLYGTDAQSLFTLDSQGLLPLLGTRVKIPADATGQWYTPVPINGSAPYYVTMQGTLAVVQLSSNVVAVNQALPFTQSIRETDATASCELDLGNELLPHHVPISLPSGVVIDLRPYASSPNVAAYWPAGAPSVNVDLMFSPRGMLTGPQAALGPIHFLLRDVRDATEGNNPQWVGADNPGNVLEQKPKHDMLVLTIFPQTGHVATFPVDLTDAAGGPDNYADDLYRFARLGSGAGS